MILAVLSALAAAAPARLALSPAPPVPLLALPVTDSSAPPLPPARITVSPEGAVVSVEPLEGPLPPVWVAHLSALQFAPAESAWSVEVRLVPQAPAPAPVPSPSPEAETDDAMVVQARTAAAALEASSEAVTVLETEVAQQQSADLGEVLARSAGAGVRRSGGLGSEGQVSMSGLTGDQIRVFLDGVPLALAGYPLGLSGVPVDLVQRIESYRGVVPVRFGADALGGAINLVSEEVGAGAGGSLSYQAGAFGTHRVAAQARAGTAGGLFARATGFFDVADNDYTVDVEVPDEQGQLSEATVHRFHDGYRAGGGTLELGVADKPWAQRLSVRGFRSGFYREIQNNIVMTVPYGEPTYTIAAHGATVQYTQDLGAAFLLDVVAGGSWAARSYVDTSTCVYDWFGQCVRERSTPGEIEALGADQVAWDRTGLARIVVGWRPLDVSGLTLSLAPTVFSRTGEDRLIEAGERDPLTAQRDSAQLVSGLEHLLDLSDRQVENRLFVKHYLQRLDSEEPLTTGALQEVDRLTQRAGVGDGLRVQLAPWLRLKASYEWATRLPNPEEIFGDAVLVLDNLALSPERSHNTNLRLSAGGQTAAGELTAGAAWTMRWADDLIVLLGSDRSYTYQNVYAARSRGVEGELGWVSVGEWVSVSGNGTWLDLRNTSSEGTFADFAGDRIPNRPWLFANGNLRLGASDVASGGDRLTLDWYTRYVHSFYRGWESVGLTAFQQEVAAQLSHTAALTYAVARPDRGQRVSASVEVQNITDAQLYDFFGVQRPGRAAYGKLTVSR